ncbi:hypothetical protein [Pseudofrankia inefficax]|uniref:hypothetical protein n=1 Tax=Pseudofrankia inefficax (strain DSM 45817 / CECT 9037 / DDB 130130 / EuI1c) TaxID=298654 RepID=UPI0034A1BC27
MTQAEVALAIGVTKGQVSMWESRTDPAPSVWPPRDDRGSTWALESYLPPLLQTVRRRVRPVQGPFRSPLGQRAGVVLALNGTLDRVRDAVAKVERKVLGGTDTDRLGEVLYEIVDALKRLPS